MVDVTASVICDSIGEHSPRLCTMRCRSPKFIHQESLRHRMIYIEDALRGDFDFSFSVSSARAIPFAKLVDQARSPELMAKPVKWGAEQKGMSMGDELEGETRERAILVWEMVASSAAYHAQMMADIGAHKSIVNRIIEPYIHVDFLATAVEAGWMNFFGLRLDGAADPTLRALAEQMWAAWNEGQPKLRMPGHSDAWHLPFADDGETNSEIMLQHRYLGRDNSEEFDEEAILRDRIRVSVARCARLSYASFETGRRSTIEEDLALYDRLITSRPIHASLAEHMATPDQPRRWGQFDAHKIGDCDGASEDDMHGALYWEHPELHGNLPGWCQYRKMLPGEAVAELPEAYR